MRRGSSIGSLSLRPSWCVSRLMSSWYQELGRPGQPRMRPRPFPSFSTPAPIRSGSDSSPASPAWKIHQHGMDSGESARRGQPARRQDAGAGRRRPHGDGQGAGASRAHAAAQALARTHLRGQPLRRRSPVVRARLDAQEQAGQPELRLRRQRQRGPPGRRPRRGREARAFRWSPRRSSRTAARRRMRP